MIRTKQVLMVLLASVLLAACVSTPTPTPTTLPIVAATVSTHTPFPRTSTPTAPPVGRTAALSEIVGQVLGRPSPSAGFVPLGEGFVLGVGGQVQTGVASSVRLDFSEGTILRLSETTSFTLQDTEVEGGQIFRRVRLELGKIWVSLVGGEVEVETPIGVASVRGSFAVFEYDPGDPDDPTDDVLILSCLEGDCTAKNDQVDESLGNLQQITLTGGGQTTVLVLSGQDIQQFLQTNPEGTRIIATLTAAPPFTATAAQNATQTSTAATATAQATSSGTPRASATSSPPASATASPRASATSSPRPSATTTPRPSATHTPVSSSPTSTPINTLTVNSTADAVDASPGNGVCVTATGDCTLRAAIQEANALTGVQTISFGVNGNFSLTITGSGENAAATGDLDVTQSVNIVGNGSANTIIAAASLGDRIFHVQSGATLNLQSMQLHSGNAGASGDGGGALLVSASTANLTSVDLNNNTALNGGGISAISGSTLAITNSTVSNNSATNKGGGVYSTGTLNVTGSTFSTNTAANDYGGAIANIGGTTTVTTSTFTSNTGKDSGGGIYSGSTLKVSDSTFTSNSATNDGVGGAIGSNGTAEISNSTFETNRGGAVGGLAATGGTLKILNSTFSANNGSVYAEGTGTAVTITNSTVAGDYSASNTFTNATIRFGTGTPTITLINSIVANHATSSAAAACGAAVTDGGGNLQFGGTTANSCGANLPTSDPQLSALANNGGNTKTMKISQSSPANNTGVSASCPTSDQRGTARGAPIYCDIGAYEHADSAIVVNSTSDDITTSSICSLRGAIITANTNTNTGGCVASGGIDVITFSVSGTFTLSLTGAGEDASATGDLDLTESVIIKGNGASSTIIDANSIDRVFHVVNNTTVTTLYSLAIRKGSITTAGGGLFNNGGNVMLSQVALDQNVAGTDGGGVYNTNTGILSISQSAITGNSGNNGAGLYNSSGTVTLRNVTLSGNTATNAGGGIASWGATTLNNVTIANNTATAGNGISLSGGTLTMQNSLVANPSSTAGSNNCALGLSMFITANNYNLEFASTGSCGFSGTDITTSSSLNLGALTGSPAYHPLNAGSPALNAANPATPGSGGNACESVDQLGTTRPQSTQCDIGAYESP